MVCAHMCARLNYASCRKTFVDKVILHTAITFESQLGYMCSFHYYNFLYDLSNYEQIQIFDVVYENQTTSGAHPSGKRKVFSVIAT